VPPLPPPVRRRGDLDPEHLEPHYRVELAYAVVLVGLVAAIERTTNERWAPREKAA
jgi:hypothetical protein